MLLKRCTIPAIAPANGERSIRLARQTTRGRAQAALHPRRPRRRERRTEDNPRGRRTPTPREDHDRRRGAHNRVRRRARPILRSHEAVRSGRTAGGHALPLLGRLRRPRLL